MADDRVPEASVRSTPPRRPREGRGGGPALDATDRGIISALAADGRMSVRALAQKLHISRANAYARVERLLASGVIRGFRAEINPAAVGLATSAYVTLKLRQADWRDVLDRLHRVTGVAHIALVAGEFDVIMLVRARDNADLRRIVLDEIQSMPGVLGTRTLLVFDELDPGPTVDPGPSAGPAGDR